MTIIHEIPIENHFSDVDYTSDEIPDDYYKLSRNKKLSDFTKMYKCFEPDFCKLLVKNLKKNKEWSTHSYSEYGGEMHSFDNDLSVSFYGSEETEYIMKVLWEVIYTYMKFYRFPWFNSWNRFSAVRYNRYDKGTEMRLHCDHITTLFDGHQKGIPILTVLGSLNNNYKGGELILFGDTKINLTEGSVIIFPSIFLYPHVVKPVTSGTRYSFVSWVW